MKLKRHKTMKEDEKRAKCPVCGRFCKREAVDKYNELRGQRSKLIKERDAMSLENGVLRKELAEAQEKCANAEKRAEDYESLYIDTRGKLDQACADVKRFHDKLADAGTKLVSMQAECNDLRSENERLCSRGLWARIINKRI